MNRNSSIADRYDALLKANELARSTSTIDETFRGMCRILKRLVEYDRAVLMSYDAESDSLRIESLYGPYKNSVFHLGYLLPRKSSQGGGTLQRKTAAISRDLTKQARFPSDKQALDEGYRSLCSVPLIVSDLGIGVVTVLGTRKNQFSVRDSQIVQELSNEIVMTVLSRVSRCPLHPDTRLLCPKCIGAIGGRTTVTKYREAMSNWGKQGGRGHKKTEFS